MTFGVQALAFSLFRPRFAVSAANLQQTPARLLAPRGLSGGGGAICSKRTGKNGNRPAFAPTRVTDAVIFPQCGEFRVVPWKMMLSPGIRAVGGCRRVS
jgi:hypothetical protein